MDTSKSVFVLHGVDAAEQPVLRRKLRRRQVLEFFAKLPPTRIGLEACGGAHYWGREISALGHEVVLVPPQRVKPYVPRNKNDTKDAEGMCEAMSRPQMRFVSIKTAEQQAALMLASVRDQLIARRTQLSNMISGHATELGVVAAKGLAKIERCWLEEAIPTLARETFGALAEDYAQVERQLRKIEAKLMAWHRSNETSRRLAEVPTIGPIGATQLVMKVTEPAAFRPGRNFSAWVGLTPKDHSTAGKTRHGVITRAGDETLRRILVAGATAVIQQVKKGRPASPWLTDLVKRKPAKLAAVALANKTARIAWKLMVSGERYRPEVASRARHAAAPARGCSASRPALDAHAVQGAMPLPAATARA